VVDPSDPPIALDPPNVAPPDPDPPTSDPPSSPQAGRVGVPQAVNNLRHPLGSHLGQRPTSRSQCHPCVIAPHAIEAGSR
jgi:hypothetical protein